MRTRLAPTPSGFLHLGNAANFVLCWLLARSQGGEVVLRIEDTDRTRARTEFVQDIFDTLAWLGLDWDHGPAGPDDTASPFFQSSPIRQERYREVLESWKSQGHLYPCRCTRRDLSLAAPQVARIAESAAFGKPYPYTCRERSPSEAHPSDAWRLRVPAIPSGFDDAWQERQFLSNLEACPDPVLCRADGCFAYHLAVCLDDHDQGISLAARGLDLLPWTHLHLHIHRLLGGTPPAFAHHGLLGGTQGERLAKSAGSLSLARLRQDGLRPEDVLGRLLPFLHPQNEKGDRAISLQELLAMGTPRPMS